MKYFLEMSGPCGGTETIELDCNSLDEAIEQAYGETEDWSKEGDYGIEGARFNAQWRILSEDQEELDSGWIEVNIDPDEEALIREAGGNPLCEHEWTSEGEGGCKENPGVWSTGGTSFSFATHCRVCGLHKTELVTGCQYNPGEHDRLIFSQPDDWCQECQSEICEC